MGLAVLCVIAALFAYIWGMQNFIQSPVPSVLVVIGVVGLSYSLLLSAHYYKTATSVLVGFVFLTCGCTIQKILVP
ncbi:hypothetical protein [Bacillus gaemokensis]|uniref:Membrane protein n=1 Tax=Bacillus gaemokensis TaxID=574375 RepID=A0A073KSJ9_9BACI|nr:hypothetical protein [Bacillus gaemokensis]KEK25368.1 membrane protein [Bacillus gaemokensis]KYG37188.1 hypothetical protein AZF08_07200 [Bacillus gaemokensis]